MKKRTCPVIGLLGEINDERTITMQNTYTSAIEKSGGVPIIFPFIENRLAVDRLIDICDGFLFTGGADVAPTRYGEEIKPTCGAIQYQRDAFEFKMFDAVIDTGKPILAICRGAQLVNVALGGTLYQDLPDEMPSPIAHRQVEPKWAMSHDIKILADTPLYSLIGADRMHGNSFHHQAIKRLGAGLQVMAMADDGIVEAVYLPGTRYLRAYQWHPERLVDADDKNRMIFDDFLAACKVTLTEL